MKRKLYHRSCSYTTLFADKEMFIVDLSVLPQNKLAQIQMNETKFWFHSYYNHKIKLPLWTDIPDISGTDLIIDTFRWNM